MAQALAGRRIFVVEDEFLISLLLETALEDEHCAIIGPFDRVPAALAAAAAAEKVDLALLDVNVGGEKVYPVAEFFAERGIPFLLLSGFEDQAAPPRAANDPRWEVFSKPFKIGALLGKMNDLLTQPAGETMRLGSD
jgi:DNA-binding NtrC family response regulator